MQPRQSPSVRLRHLFRAPLLDPRALHRTLLAASLIVGGATVSWAANPVQGVDDAFITSNASTGKNWPSYGLNYQENRFSPLKAIAPNNVAQLGLAWSYDLDATRGVESTPIVVNGVMYVTAPWSVVHAVDAKTGAKLWTYDPKVPRDMGYKGCCDVVNRGVAVYQGRVYVASFDGRLIALDAETGQMFWEKDTIEDKSRAYTITAAPRAYKGRIYIGNGGGEYGVRGYVSAYDAATGEQKWRFYTVPGDPAKPFEDKAQAMAAKTWDPSGKYWETGGGGTVWNSMAFDPELNLMYIGTGNGSPWAHRKRSPKGGDNLFLASIVALNPDTGAYRWHYQETPGDNWDYNSAMDIIQADITVQGKPRKALLHAPKNGFFYVIDRATGQFISANNFVPVNWAKGYTKDGKVIPIAAARVPDKPVDAVPGPYGAHNWQSMAYSPQTQLAYIPAQHIPLNLMDDPRWKGFNSNTPGEYMSNTGWNSAKVLNAAPDMSKPMGRLIAWDPIRQKEAWHVQHTSPWNGGLLSTASGLLFQGTADGRLLAYDARNGKQLWSTPVNSGVIAAPITYEVDGTQYLSVAVGWGGVYGLANKATNHNTKGTVYTYVIGGTAAAPQPVVTPQTAAITGVPYDKSLVSEGLNLYLSSCVGCHGVPGVGRGGAIPNLGYVPAAMVDNLKTFIVNGPATQRGMPNFAGKLTDAEIDKIRAFILEASAGAAAAASAAAASAPASASPAGPGNNAAK